MNYSLLPSYILTGLFLAAFIARAIPVLIIPGLRDLFTSKTAGRNAKVEP